MAMQCNKRKEDLLLSNLDYGVLHKFETPINIIKDKKVI